MPALVHLHTDIARPLLWQSGVSGSLSLSLSLSLSPPPPPRKASESLGGASRQKTSKDIAGGRSRAPLAEGLDGPAHSQLCGPAHSQLRGRVPRETSLMEESEGGEG